MGKKVSPHALRIGITRSWDSKWYAKGDYKEQFLQDLKIREFVKKACAKASVAKVEIVRSAGKVTTIVHAARPGVIIGRGGEEITKLEKELKRTFKADFEVNVQEIRKPEANAQLIADNVVEQIERRFPYRRVMKMAVEKAKESGVKGVKVMASGRLNGVDIARQEVYSSGTVPLHTLRANIDYATAEADTMYGVIGIKVWTYHGLVFKNKDLE